MDKEKDISYRNVSCSNAPESKNNTVPTTDSRSILVFKQMDDELTKDFVSKLIELETKDAEKDIKVFINSPGGYVTSLFCMLDSLRLVKPDIKTYCLGEAASAAAVLTMSGTKGKRYITKHSRILLHQLSSFALGHIADVKISVKESERINSILMDIIIERTKIKRKELKKLISRDCWLSAQEALEYGLVDHIL